MLDASLLTWHVCCPQQVSMLLLEVESLHVLDPIIAVVALMTSSHLHVANIAEVQVSPLQILLVLL